MDAVWSFRSAYNEARKVKDAQDAYCAKAHAGLWNEIQGQSLPENLQWEALVDVLRGRVKVRVLALVIQWLTMRRKISNHCYEAVDLDAIVRVSICYTVWHRRGTAHTGA